MDFIRSNRIRGPDNPVELLLDEFGRRRGFRPASDFDPEEAIPEGSDIIPGTPQTEIVDPEEVLVSATQMNTGSAGTAGVFTPYNLAGDAAKALLKEMQEAIRRNKRQRCSLTRRSEAWFNRFPEYIDDYYNGQRIEPTADQILSWRRYKGIFAPKYRRYGARRLTKPKTYSRRRPYARARIYRRRS